MADIRVNIQPVIQNMGPLGFHQLASQFFVAARAVKDAVPSCESPCYLLYCQSLELILKAFLLLKRISQAKLKRQPYGHDLEALLKEANHQGLDTYVRVT